MYIIFFSIAGKCSYSRLLWRHTGGQIRQDGVAQGDAGQELWQVRTHQVHPSGGTGHDAVRLAVDSGDFSEPQISDESRCRCETNLRTAIVEEKEIISRIKSYGCFVCVYIVCTVDVRNPDV